MKILSYNVRGLGGSGKRRIIRELVCQNHVEFLCLQETKIQNTDSRVCLQVWGDSDFEWKAIQAENRSGGILCVWKKNLFVLESSVEGPGYLGLIGLWGNDQQRCVIVNIYSGCSIAEKRALWSALISWRCSCHVDAWCLVGDFNAVRNADERRGSSGTLNSQRLEMREFNDFIYEMELLDLPLAGRKFTWRRPNNQAKSRIDRYIVSAEWNVLWPNCSQLVLDRNISDHSPLLLRQSFQNWGPKPFRVC